MSFQSLITHQLPQGTPPVVFGQSETVYHCHVRGGARTDPCAKTSGYSTKQIDVHMIENHRLCCFNHALSTKMIKYRCPYNCRCVFKPNEHAAGFYTSDQMLLHLYTYHRQEQTYEKSRQEVRKKTQEGRSNAMKLKMAQRLEKIVERDQCAESAIKNLEYRNLELDLLKQEVNRQCSDFDWDAYGRKVELAISEYAARSSETVQIHRGA